MSPPRMPNLFLLGAPKSGTTAMSRFLAGHRAIYMSEQAGAKETSHFATDLWLEPSKVTSRVDYLALFADAPSQARYLGEASTSYLQSRAAVPAILAAVPDAKLVVMLRSPLAVARGLHNHFVKRCIEPIVDFEKAWRAQQPRQEGRLLPRWQTDPRFFQYGERARLGSQLERLLELAPREQLHIILHEDLQADPWRVWCQLLGFLQLEPDGDVSFEVLNASQQFRVPQVQAVMARLRALREWLGIPGGLGIHRAINRINARPGKRNLRPAFERELQCYFRDEVRLLSALLGRDLEHWLD